MQHLKNEILREQTIHGRKVKVKMRAPWKNISHYHVLGSRNVSKSTTYTNPSMAMNDVNVPLFLCVWENSWKEQQTLFACTQERRRSIVDLNCTDAKKEKLTELQKPMTPTIQVLIICFKYILFDIKWPNRIIWNSRSSQKR